MSPEVWNVTFKIYRKKGDQAPHYDEFKLEVNPDEYVLDAVERIWAFHDRSLTFRHACHHSTCGACGMRVNEREKLTCITPIREVTTNGGVVKVDPLRNFPVVSDVVVDMGWFYQRMAQSDQQQIIPVIVEPVKAEIPVKTEEGEPYLRLSDCIECGLCMSACPSMATSEDYFGPAPLAGLHQISVKNGKVHLLNLADSEDGVWRCHSAYECTSVCPSNVEPAWRIMDLRRKIVGERFKRLFRSGD